MADSQKKPISSMADLAYTTGAKLSSSWNPGFKPTQAAISAAKRTAVVNNLRKLAQ